MLSLLSDWAGFEAGRTRRPLIHTRIDTGFSGKLLLVSTILAFIGDFCLNAAFEKGKDTRGDKYDFAAHLDWFGMTF